MVQASEGAWGLTEGRAIRDVAWRGQVASRAAHLQADLEWAKAGSENDMVQATCAQQNIDLALEIAGSAPKLLSWTWMERWSSGADIEAAWSAIHAAEAALIMILPRATIHARLPDLRAALTTTLQGDGRVDGYTTDLKRFEDGGVDAIGLPERERIRVIRTAISDASDAAHLNIRNYRNWLLIVSLVVIVSLIAVAIAHLADSEFLYIAEGGSSPHVGADVLQLEAAGAVGGLLMALFALIRLQVYSGPVALPLWLALARVPAGAAAGLVGAVLLQGRVISSIMPQTRSGLIGYAVLFGAAPEIVLRFLDKRVNDATSAARAQSDPLKSVPHQSPATSAATSLTASAAKQAPAATVTPAPDATATPAPDATTTAAPDATTTPAPDATTTPAPEAPESGT
jgi:hypothetical protein